jgi:glyoxylase-like metal-dependent hydrolase (beta-lactamase superfamily II)
MTGNSGGTLLGELVRAGEAQTAATPVNDFIWMSKDVSNSYLVVGDGEDVVINAGMPNVGTRHRDAYAAVSQSPISHLILTQGHFDHFGGLPAFAGSGTQVVAHRDLPNVRAYWKRLGPFYSRRSNQLWQNVLALGQRPLDFHDQFDIRPDLFVTDGDTIEAGGHQFMIRAVPGGETFDSIVVWMPDRKIAFTGNLFGPIFLHHPNLNTLRGDLPRDALRFIESVERVQALGAGMLITGHGEPIIGAERIRRDLQRIKDAVLHVHDATVAGMNAGKDVHQLMREIDVPDAIAIGEGHGKIAINVRSIWEQYAGFFHYASTTELYGVPRDAVSADIVELAGGVAPIVARARRHSENGAPLEALHLIDIVRAVASDHRDAHNVEIAALTTLLEQGQGENFSETMWLKARIADARKAIEE